LPEVPTEMIVSKQPLLDLIEKVTKSDIWKDQYEALDTIRCLNKHHYPFLVACLSDIADFCKAHVENLRSNVSKNALMAVKEIFSKEHDKESADFVRKVLPACLLKVSYDKVFISNVAKQIFN